MEKSCIPTCPTCEQKGELVSGRAPEKMFYRCLACNTSVGCHPGTMQALGTMADPELRRWRITTHDSFDPLWRPGPRRAMSRHKAYRWLRGAIGISKELCHISMFDETLCRSAILAVDKFRALEVPGMMLMNKKHEGAG